MTTPTTENATPPELAPLQWTITRHPLLNPEKECPIRGIEDAAGKPFLVSIQPNAASKSGCNESERIITTSRPGGERIPSFPDPERRRKNRLMFEPPARASTIVVTGLKLSLALLNSLLFLTGVFTPQFA